MASLAELARLHTTLDVRAVAHLQRLVASWGILADLCFADLLLHAAVDGDPDRVVALGHIRPITAQTIYWTDWMGSVAPPGGRPLVTRTLREGGVVEGEVTHPVSEELVQVLAVPVRFEGQVVAALTRESLRSLGRHAGELEETYLGVFMFLAGMVADGTFPFASEVRQSETVPRVGDGVVVLGADQRITFSSPNAISAFHRLGVHGRAVGATFAELGLDESVVQRAVLERQPVTCDVEHGADFVLVMRCVPLLHDGAVVGVLVLVRDVSELRARDQLIRTKEATIQEIHHRVKNNLQTISSLLRLQGRRLASPEAKAAIDESVRRIRTIALVHETLSRESADEVPFVEILRPLLRMVEEGLVAPERPVRFRIEGDVGKLPAPIATPLAVVLTELFQNVVDHAYAPLAPPVHGDVLVQLAVGEEAVIVRVVDDGVGVPVGFAAESSAGLGLSIVGALVTGELRGTLSIDRGAGGGDRPGTVAEVAIPLVAGSESDPPSGDGLSGGATRPPEAGGRV